jgi:subtilase family protein
MKAWLAVVIWALAGCAAHKARPAPPAPKPSSADAPERTLRAIRAGDLRFRLTTPDETRALLGPPDRQSSRRDGGMEVVDLEYPKVRLRFGGPAREQRPATLLEVRVRDVGQDIGAGRVVVLRTLADLSRLDSWTALRGVSLERLDLRDQGERLAAMNFDTRTVWPPGDRLPAGFDPAARMEAGRNPGLGIRALHARGIDGRGVGLAIIDQPLLLEHEEYRAQLAHYEKVDVERMDPQYHASRVASIAVGRTLGVAPGARLSFYAVPMWKFDSQQFAAVLDRIVQRNTGLAPPERVHVVSISTGMFPKLAGFEQWQAARKRAEEAGIFLVTCDPADLRYGLLRLENGQDPDAPGSYRRGCCVMDAASLLAPGDGRTLASEDGPDVYAYEPEGGMSWGAPWIAGLAALGFQVAPCATPEMVKRALVETATPTPVGPVASPTKFVQVMEKACRGHPRR